MYTANRAEEMASIAARCFGSWLFETPSCWLLQAVCNVKL